MAAETKLAQLTNAIDRYGDVSVEMYQRVKRLGYDVLAALPRYLGDSARVYGVPPSGEWRPDNYRDAMFSYYGGGTLSVGPAEIGLAVAIPHKKDEGELWVRVIVEIDPKARSFCVRVGDSSKSVEIDEPYAEPSITRICDAIHEYLLAMFDDPVSLATAEGRGRIGFITG